MYSAEILLSQFQQVQREYKHKNKDLYEVACEIVYYFETLERQAGSKKHLTFIEIQEELITMMDSFVFVAEQQLSNNTEEEQQSLLDVYFATLSFLRVAPLYDERFVTYVEVSENDSYIKMFCVDPSSLLQKMSKGYKAKVFFSATMSPFLYYQEMLGLSKENYATSIGSPFNENQSEVYIQPISTRFKDRDKTKDKLVNMLLQETRQQGNYLIFFPSYQYLESIYSSFVEIAPEVDTVVQDIRMSEIEREAFINSFSAKNTKTLVGFAVLGGIF
jgi:DNA excision repair protein ERCC-2